ncbi:hypothetical protein JCM8547_004292 [Rhodosporidiobolus lusitaniae]
MPPFFPVVRDLLHRPFVRSSNNKPRKTSPPSPSSSPVLQPPAAPVTPPHLLPTSLPRLTSAQKQYLRNPAGVVLVRKDGTMEIRAVRHGEGEEERVLRADGEREEERESEEEWLRRRALQVFDNFPTFLSLDSSFALCLSLFQHPSPSSSLLEHTFLRLLSDLNELLHLSLSPSYLSPENLPELLDDLAGPYALFVYTYVKSYYRFRRTMTPLPSGNRVMDRWVSWLGLRDQIPRRRRARKEVERVAAMNGGREVRWKEGTPQVRLSDYLAVASPEKWEEFIPALRLMVQQDHDREREQQEAEAALRLQKEHLQKPTTMVKVTVDPIQHLEHSVLPPDSPPPVPLKVIQKEMRRRERRRS